MPWFSAWKLGGVKNHEGRCHNMVLLSSGSLSQSSLYLGFPGGSTVKNPPAVQETWVWSLGQGDPLEKGMATHSSILALRISWTEKPGRLFSPWVAKSQTRLREQHFHFSLHLMASHWKTRRKSILNPVSIQQWVAFIHKFINSLKNKLQPFHPIMRSIFSVFYFHIMPLCPVDITTELV